MTVAIGADIARFGYDLTGVAIVEDHRVKGLDEWANKDLMETAGRLVNIKKRYPDSIIAIDDTGLGGGVVDRLMELGIEVLAINYGSQAYEHDRFRDKASEMWWRVRELHDPHMEVNIVYPSFHNLTGRLMAQLAGARYKFDSRGRVWIVKNDNNSESPDLGDALALAYEAWVTHWMLAPSRRENRIVRNNAVFGQYAPGA